MTPSSLTVPAAAPSLRLALAAADAHYDSSIGLLKSRVGNIGYHTTLAEGTPVHPTRESLGYAFGLLESGEAAHVNRAHEILRRMISLQDTDSESHTYGIWSWFYEEPPAKMSPPDWNWADFNGTQLIQILLRHEGKLEAALIRPVREAIGHAARSIIRRNVTPAYTNIAIMGTYVTLMAGTLLGDAEFTAYGKERLRRFLDFTRAWGGFPEYNSPNYMLVGLVEITRMLRDFQAPDDLLLARELADRLWEEIARHWHAPSRQWAGPHSRAYQTLLGPNQLGTLQRALGDAVALTDAVAPSYEEATLPLACPALYLSHFVHAPSPQERRIPIAEGEPRLEGVTYLSPRFALSSAERGTFWVQSRSLLAYATAQGKPVSLRARFLRDGYDYAAANLFAAQDREEIVALVGFASDGGNTHCHFDRLRNATIPARDWRLRFEFEGAAPFRDAPPEFSTRECLRFDFGDGAVGHLRIPWLEFGSQAAQRARWEVSATENGGCALDLVLHAGEEKTFVFNDDFPAAIGIALAIRERGMIPGGLERVDVNATEEAVTLAWRGKSRLEAAAPRFARSEAALVSFARERKEALRQRVAGGSFRAFDERARAGENLRVAFLGGSLTWGAVASDPQITSCRARLARQLEATYPEAHFRCHDAAIGGTGSTLGIFRLERDVLAHGPDLVFLDFTINDNPYAEPDPLRLAAYETIVRRLVEKGIPVVMAIFAVKKDLGATPPARPLDCLHKAIAEAYRLPVGDAVAWMRREVAEKGIDPADLWPISPDETHPGDEGYGLYAEAVWDAYRRAVEGGIVCRLPAEPLHGNTFAHHHRVRLSALPLPAGWTKGRPHRTGITFDFQPSRWLDDLAIASHGKEENAAPPAPLRLKVRASTLALYGEVTPESGNVAIRVNGGEPVIHEPGAMARQGALRYFILIASGLDETAEHGIEITPALSPGGQLRFESLCLASGAPVALRVER